MSTSTPPQDLTHIKALADAIDKILGEDGKTQRFVDVSRIPLICLSITQINGSLLELKSMMKDLKTQYVSQETFSPIQKIVYGLAGLLMTGVIVALLALLFQK